MSESEFSYLTVRAVRDETGASHDECRRALTASGGDVTRAIALWFDSRRVGDVAAASHPSRKPDAQTESEP